MEGSLSLSSKPSNVKVCEILSVVFVGFDRRTAIRGFAEDFAQAETTATTVVANVQHISARRIQRVIFQPTGGTRCLFEQLRTSQSAARTPKRLSRTDQVNYLAADACFVTNVADTIGQGCRRAA